MNPFVKHIVAKLLFVAILILGALGMFLIGADPLTNGLFVAGVAVAIKIDDHFIAKKRLRTI